MKDEGNVLLGIWWERLLPLTRKFVRETMLKGLDKDDLHQECYLQLKKVIERYDPSLGVPLPSYYKRIIYGWRANQNKKAWNSRVILQDELLAFMEDSRADVEEEVQTKLLMEKVYAALNQMDEKVKAIIILYYIEEKSLKEIGESLALSYKAVENRKSKGLKVLRDYLLKSK